LGVPVGGGGPTTAQEHQWKQSEGRKSKTKKKKKRNHHKPKRGLNPAKKTKHQEGGLGEKGQTTGVLKRPKKTKPRRKGVGKEKEKATRYRNKTRSMGKALPKK